MPIAEAYQQAILNGVMQNLLTAAGGSFKVALFRSNVELSGNGYTQKTISTVPSASAIGVNGLSTVRLTTDTTLTASGGDIIFDSIKILDSTGTNQVLPTFLVAGTITSGESKKVTAVFGLPDNDNTLTRITSLEDDVAAIEVAIDGVEPLTSVAAIQDAITNAKTYGRSVRIGNGNFVQTSTISVGETSGHHIYGESVSEANDQASSLLNLATNLVWGGARDGTEVMFRYSGVDATISRIGWMGATRTQIDALAVAKVDTIFEMKRAIASGIGTGKVNGEDLYFCYGKKGLVLGTALGDGNCDESSWNRCFFDRMDTGVVFNNYQCLEHRFWAPRFRLSQICFEINAGGALTVIGGNMTHTSKFMYFPENSSNNFGQNSNSYLVEHLKLDSQSTGGMVIDQFPVANQTYYSDFCIHKLHLPSPQINGVDKPYWHLSNGTDINDIQPIFMLSGSSHLNLEDCSTLQRGMIAWDAPGGYVTIEIDGGRIWWGNGGTAVSAVSQLLNLQKSRGTAYVKILNNVRQTSSRNFYSPYEADAVGLLV